MDHPIGTVLFVGFDGLEVDPALRLFLENLRPGGLILFKRNIKDPDQVLRLIEDLKSLYMPPPLIAIDEEGGRVSRLREIAPTLPPAFTMRAWRTPAHIENAAFSLGRVLASLDIDIDFAPVSDLSPPDARNGIGDRSFGTDPLDVSESVGAYLDGLARAGISGCLKHFPGLGPTACDSHLELPTVNKPARAFLKEDLVPFRRLRDRAPIVMIGHGHYPFLAGPAPIAATLCPSIADRLLRDEVGFDGLAMADDLEMKAVSAHMGYDDLAPRALSAGCDMLLVCTRREAIERSHAALERWADDGRLEQARLHEAYGRVASLRERVAACREKAGPSSGRSRSAFDVACSDLAAVLEETAAT